MEDPYTLAVEDLYRTIRCHSPGTCPKGEAMPSPFAAATDI